VQCTVLKSEVQCTVPKSEVQCIVPKSELKGTVPKVKCSALYLKVKRSALYQKVKCSALYQKAEVGPCAKSPLCFSPISQAFKRNAAILKLGLLHKNSLFTNGTPLGPLHKVSNFYQIL
jgi:hypothetical protein